MSLAVFVVTTLCLRGGSQVGKKSMRAQLWRILSDFITQEPAVGSVYLGSRRNTGVLDFQSSSGSAARLVCWYGGRRSVNSALYITATYVPFVTLSVVYVPLTDGVFRVRSTFHMYVPHTDRLFPLISLVYTAIALRLCKWT